MNKLGVLGIVIAAVLIPFNVQAFADSHVAKAVFYFQEGLADLVFGEYKKAIRHFDQAINLDPNYIDAYINKGIAFHEMGNVDEAISNYDIALEIEPENPVALNNKGYVFSKMKKYDEAIPYYNRALEIDPVYLDAMYNLADVFWKQWYCQDAIIYYDKIIEIDPEPSQAYLHKAWALSGMGRVEDAISNLDIALESDPNILKPFDYTFVAMIDQNRFSAEFWQNLLQQHPHVWKGVNDKSVGFKVLEMDEAELETVCIKPGGPDLYVEPEFDEKSLEIGDDSKINLDKEKKLESSPKIPDWIKQVGEFWIQDQIDDAGFVQVIEFLVQEGIITIPYAEAPEGEAATQIPSWIKSNTEFWVTGKISDDEFTIGLEWLINNGIIRV